MKIFRCDNCGHPLFFENRKCGNCGQVCGFRDSDRRMISFEIEEPIMVSPIVGGSYRYCKNKELDVCNWLVEEGNPHQYCRACQLNRTIPDLSKSKNHEKWQQLEVAKHRLIYQLQKLGLTIKSKLSDTDGFCFDFVAKLDNNHLMTGHANGVITILLKEADSVHREKTRKEMVEPYRSIIGHLRHEVGHYYWDRLILKDAELLTAYRGLFGDEQINYSTSLKRYYKSGAPSDWQNSHISKYASSHPWEDWAETWAHYLHVMDMVETAYFFGFNISPVGSWDYMDAKVDFDPYTEPDFDAILKICVPLSFAVNSMNRSMGVPDVYPFVISPKVVEKMKFIHRLLLTQRM
jgi:hypothetical protein